MSNAFYEPSSLHQSMSGSSSLTLSRMGLGKSDSTASSQAKSVNVMRRRDEKRQNKDESLATVSKDERTNYSF